MTHDARNARGTGGDWSRGFPVYEERLQAMAEHLGGQQANWEQWYWPGVTPPIPGDGYGMCRVYDPTQRDEG